MGSKAQTLTVTQPFHPMSDSSTVLSVYKEQFGKWEKPDLDDTFPYVVIRIGLDGDIRTTTIAKQMLGLYLGTQTAVEAIYKDVENELIFLIPARARHIEVTCGEGCARQIIMDMAQLKSNTIYYGRLHYVPDMGSINTMMQAPKRQTFTFKLFPHDAGLRVMVDGSWQRWPVADGNATRSLDHGTYQYEVTAERYNKHTGTIVVSDESVSCEVKLQPQFGWLYIEESDELKNAYVYVTNTVTSVFKQLGQLPMEPKELDEGTYLIEIIQEKYKDYSKQLTIVNGDTAKLKPRLVANYSPATLVIDDGIDIYIDNRYIGTGTWTGTLANGEFSVETRKDGHRSAYTLVRITPEDLTNMYILNTPVPAFGTMVVEGEPNGAVVYVDNERVGETPLVVNQVKIGNRKLRVESDGFAAEIRDVLIEENQEQWVNYTLSVATKETIVEEVSVAPEKEQPVIVAEELPENNSPSMDVYSVENATLPEIATIPNANVLGTTIIVGANISHDGGATITERGFCYSFADPLPTIEHNKLKLVGGKGWFTGNITKLEPATDYYIRSYAINAKGIAYGNVIKVMTTHNVPTCRTFVTNDVDVFLATIGGIIDLNGVDINTIGSYGICYKTSSEPTTSDQVIEGVIENDTIMCNLTGLSANTMYYARTFVTYNDQIIYGNEVSFKTLNNVETFNINGVSFNMVRVQGGMTKVVASPRPQGGQLLGAQGNSIISLPDFYIGETEVTQRLWEAVMGYNPSASKGGNAPVENVSWHDCQKFITKLNELSGMKFKLPTETEWEYAARGGIYSKGYKFSGSNIAREVAWLYDNHVSAPQTTKRLSPNELGIYDMSGNVREWCEEVFDHSGNPIDYVNNLDTNQLVSICRSSSFKLKEEYGNISSYMIRPTTFSSNDLGLRLMLVAGNTELIVVSAPAVKNISQTSADVDITVKFNGGAPISESGVCYSTKENPTTSDKRIENSLQGENTIITISDLQPGQTYYVRGYALNSIGVTYGKQISFTTADIKTITVNGISFDMMQVKGGTFMMGSGDNDAEAQAFEFPQHQVSLSDYYICKTEVTQELWQAVMGENPSADKRSLQNPVEMVSWEDCQLFITKLNELTGEKFRLPTEAEWEFAARGGLCSLHYKYAGNKMIDLVGWGSVNSGNMSHPVAQKSPNELGLYDMSGNVWEWCSDWYGGYAELAQTNPQGPNIGSMHVVRGGSFTLDTRYLRVSSRYYHLPTYKSKDFGFRLAM